ncbi:hypothetical protein P3805_01855 [Pseudomonas aeruginosa]|nr:hypothetical protein [Pseudomonas aeruginosa]
MPFPNSILDDAPDVWGWPWHGLIKQAIGAGGAVLTLPSGATMDMPSIALMQDSYLWDVGMPEPAVTTDNPDEQWLSKAILRGSGQCYGGMDAGSAAFIRGRTVSATVSTSQTGGLLWFDVYFVDHGGAVPIEQQATSNILGWQDLGLESSPHSLSVSLIDRGHDGTRRLYLVNYFKSASDTGARAAFVELHLQPTGSAGFFATLSVVATYPQVNYQITAISLPDVDLDVYTRIWRADSGGYEQGPEAPPGETVEYSVRSGNWQLTCAVERILWMWYGTSGALEPLTYSVLQTWDWSRTGGVVGGDHVEVDEVYSVRYDLSLAAGSAGTTLQVAHQSTSHSNMGSPDSTGTDISWQDFISGAAVASGNVTGQPGGEHAIAFPDRATFQDVSDSTNEILWFQSSLSSFSWQPNIAVQSFSNKILALRFFRDDRQNGVQQRYISLAPAVTPHGPQGAEILDFDAGALTQQQRERWLSGAYNPITGEVHRNDPSGYFAWV